MSNIVDRPEAVFDQLTPRQDTLLQKLEAEAARESIPIVGPVVGAMLGLMARLMKAKKALEVGTATGYSAIWLGRALEATGGGLTALEIDEKLAARARNNVRQAGLDDVIEVILSDALSALPRMADRYDLIFIDIEKDDYIRILPDCHRLLKEGGLLIADNVAFKDAQPFNQAVAESDDWQCLHLFAYLPRHSPEHDGICLALKVQ